ncbi:DUF3592 domain-containing protein [Rathayibacter sp. CAU 1779]
MDQKLEELPELAVRMVIEARERAPWLSLDEASARVGRVLALPPGEVRGLVIARHPDADSPPRDSEPKALGTDGVHRPARVDDPARARRGKRAALVFLWAFAVLIAVSLVWTIVSCVADVTTKRALQEHGVSVAATVTATNPGICGGRGGCIPPTINYSFTTTAGAKVTAVQADISRATFDALHVGETLPVMYDPADPSRNRPASELTSFDSTTRLLIVWTTAAAIVLLAVRLQRRFHLERLFRARPRTTAAQRPSRSPRPGPAVAYAVFIGVLWVVGCIAVFSVLLWIGTLVGNGLEAALL